MPDRTNRTSSDAEGAFGDEKRNAQKAQTETKFDKDSPLNRVASQKNNLVDQEQASDDKEGPADRDRS